MWSGFPGDESPLPMIRADRPIEDAATQISDRVSIGVSSENENRLKRLVCDFTHFFAAPELIILPQKSSFEHEVRNENKEILQPLPPYHCREYKKAA